VRFSLNSPSLPAPTPTALSARYSPPDAGLGGVKLSFQQSYALHFFSLNFFLFLERAREGEGEGEGEGDAKERNVTRAKLSGAFNGDRRGPLRTCVDGRHLIT